MKTFRKLLCGAALLATAGAAEAAVVINIVEVGANVVATASGTLDRTGLVQGTAQTIARGVRGTAPFVGLGVRDGVDAFLTPLSGLSGPASFGSGTTITIADVVTGSGFVFAGDRILVSTFFLQGQTVNATARFNNRTLAGLDLTPGTYVFTAPNDTITVNIGAPVPEPASWAMLIAGFACVGGVLRRRQADRLTPAPL